MGLTKVFFWGLIVSFLGTLPLGTLNVAAMQMGIQESIHNAIMFSIGCIVTEMIYVRISLIGVNWVRKQKKLFRWLEWITLGIVVALAIGSFSAAMHHHEEKNLILNNTINRFLLGMFLSAINPIQIPFWFGWSTILFDKKVLNPKNSYYNIYIIGIGLGSLFGNFIFIFGGQFIVAKLNANMNILNWVIGGIFALTAVIQLIKILMHKDAAEKLDQLPDAEPINENA